MRLEPQPGERIDRSRRISFTCGGGAVSAYEGDTIGSALYAAGRRVFSRSFKYHRPRGFVCCSGHCPNCMMTVDGVPNVRVCVEPAREGAVVSAQNVLGSLEHDLLSVVDKLGGPFTPVGFYYRTMIRPRRAWPLYEKFLRGVAGLGVVSGTGGHIRRDTEHRRARVLVIGGGRAGREAARAAAAEGPGVVLVDERAADEIPGVEIVAPATAIAIYEGGLVPVDAEDLLQRLERLLEPFRIFQVPRQRQQDLEVAFFQLPSFAVEPDRLRVMLLPAEDIPQRHERAGMVRLEGQHLLEQ